MKSSNKNKKKIRLVPLEASPLITVVDPISFSSEQYRAIRTSILYSNGDKKVQSIIVASVGPGEGKSTTASNLSVVFAHSGIRTILVDADLRRPTIHKTFFLDNRKGLSDLLNIRSLSISDVVKNSNIKNLDIITSGHVSPRFSEKLSSNRMKKIVRILKKEYDFIIFDVPPIGSVTDAQLISSLFDGILFVVQENKTEKAGLAEAIKTIEQVGATVLGAIYRSDSDERASDYYQYL